MSRNIEFRWFDVQAGEMIYSSALPSECWAGFSGGKLMLFGKGPDCGVTGGSIVAIDCEPMQYTGLRDINGIKIFEGDIVEDDEHYYSLIYWDDTDSMFCASEVGGIADLCHPVKVIGNIHQHPHLLK